MIDFDKLLNATVASTFGSTVIYTPAGKPAFMLASGGVFDEAAKSVDFADGVPITMAHPIVGVRASDFPPTAPPKQKDTLVVDATNYWVQDVRSDGAGGWIYLVLALVQGVKN